MSVAHYKAAGWVHFSQVKWIGSIRSGLGQQTDVSRNKAQTTLTVRPCSLLCLTNVWLFAVNDFDLLESKDGFSQALTSVIEARSRDPLLTQNSPTYSLEQDYGKNSSTFTLHRVVIPRVCFHKGSQVGKKSHSLNLVTRCYKVSNSGERKITLIMLII